MVQQGEMVVGTSLVAVVQNGLSQLHGVTSRAHFTVAMIRGLGGNLTLPSREAFAKQVIINTHYVCMFTSPSPVTHVFAYVYLYIYICVFVCAHGRACVHVHSHMCHMALQPVLTRERDRQRACHKSDTITDILDQVSYSFPAIFLCGKEWEVSGLS